MVYNGADEQALDSNPLYILLIAQYVTRTTILSPLPRLSSGAACSPDSNDIIYKGIKSHKSSLSTHTQTHTHALTIHLFTRKVNLVSWQRQSAQFLKRRFLIREMPSRVCCWGPKFTAPRIHSLPLLPLTHYREWRIPVTCHRGMLRSSHFVIRGWRCEHCDALPGFISLWAWLGSGECLDISHVSIIGISVFSNWQFNELSFGMRGMCGSVHHWDLGTTVMCVHLRYLAIPQYHLGSGPVLLGEE